MSKIRVVQVSKPGGALELVERDVPQPGRGEVRLPGRGMRDLPQRLNGKRGAYARHSVSARTGPRGRRHRRQARRERCRLDRGAARRRRLAGGSCGYCDNAGAATTSPAPRPLTSTASPWTAAMPNRWPTRGSVGAGSRTSSPPKKQRPSCAPASLLSTACATAAPSRATSSPSSASAAWDTWACNMRRRWVPHGRHRAWPGQGGARKEVRAPSTTSIARRRTRGRAAEARRRQGGAGDRSPRKP